MINFFINVGKWQGGGGEDSVSSGHLSARMAPAERRPPGQGSHDLFVPGVQCEPNQGKQVIRLW